MPGQTVPSHLGYEFKGLPQGVQYSGAPDSLTTFVLTFTVAEDAAVGSYSATVVCTDMDRDLSSSDNFTLVLEAGYKQYSSTEYGFSIKYPQNWVEETGTGAAVYYNAPAIIDNNPAASFSVQIPASAGGMTLDQLANAGKLLLENMYPSISFTNEKDVQVNGIKGHEWAVVVDNVTNVTIRQDFFIVNNQVYTITFAAISESYGDYASIFDTILDSFTVP